LKKAIPEKVYMNTQSGEFHFYIEAQVWDYDLFDSVISNQSVRRQFLVHWDGVLWYPCIKEKEK
jgi:hypothetical protein